MKRMFIIAALGMLLLFTGCGSQTRTIYKGDGVRIERQGRQTRIYDLEGGGEYTFRKVRKKKTAETVKEARITTKTDTMQIKIVQNIIIVEMPDGRTLLVK